MWHCVASTWLTSCCDNVIMQCYINLIHVMLHYVNVIYVTFHHIHVIYAMIMLGYMNTIYINILYITLKWFSLCYTVNPWFTAFSVSQWFIQFLALLAKSATFSLSGSIKFSFFQDQLPWNHQGTLVGQVLVQLAYSDVYSKTTIWNTSLSSFPFQF